MTVHDPAPPVTGSALAFIPPCRTCAAPVTECFALWRNSGGRVCCERCDHHHQPPALDRRPRPTVRAMPRGWTNQGWNTHVEEAKRALHLLTGLGVGRELGTEQGRTEVEGRIRQFTSLLLDDDDHTRATTSEIPTVPDQRQQRRPA